MYAYEAWGEYDYRPTRQLVRHAPPKFSLTVLAHPPPPPTTGCRVPHRQVPHRLSTENKTSRRGKQFFCTTRVVDPDPGGDQYAFPNPWKAWIRIWILGQIKVFEIYYHTKIKQNYFKQQPFFWASYYFFKDLKVWITRKKLDPDPCRLRIFNTTVDSIAKIQRLLAKMYSIFVRMLLLRLQ